MVAGVYMHISKCMCVDIFIRYMYMCVWMDGEIDRQADISQVHN